MMLLWKWELELWNWRIWFLWRSRSSPSHQQNEHGPLDVDLGRAISFGMTRKIQKTLTYSHFLRLIFPTPNKEREKTKTSHQKYQNNWDFSIFFPHPFRLNTSPKSLGCLGFPSSAGPWFRISSCRAFGIKNLSLNSALDIDCQWKFSDSILEMCQNPSQMSIFNSALERAPACWYPRWICHSWSFAACQTSKICHLSAHGRRKIGVFLFWQIPGITIDTAMRLRSCSCRCPQLFESHEGMAPTCGFHVSGLEESKSQRTSCCLMVKWCQIPHVCWSIPHLPPLDLNPSALVATAYISTCSGGIGWYVPGWSDLELTKPTW